VIDAWWLDDSHDAEGVHRELIKNNALRAIDLRVRASNALVRRLARTDEVWQSVRRFHAVRVSYEVGGVISLSALLLRDYDFRGSVARWQVQIRHDGTTHNELEKLVLGYDRFSTPHAALLLLAHERVLDRPCTELGVSNYVMRHYDDVYASIGDTPPIFRHWRRLPESVVCMKGTEGNWYLQCIVGPLATRDRVRAELLACEKRPPRSSDLDTVNVASLVHVLEYQPPVERHVQITPLVFVFVARHGVNVDDVKLLDMTRRSRTAERSAVITEMIGFFHSSAPRIFDVGHLVDDFMRENAGRYLKQLPCSRFRWSHQHEVCRKLTFVLLDAHRAPFYGMQLPVYVVVWIMQWADEEYVWRASEHQLMTLVNNVAASMRRVRERRALLTKRANEMITPSEQSK